MLTWIRTRLTFSNVTASLALVFALGGTATAAVLITGDDIASNTITARNLAKSAVTGKKLGKGAVTTRALSRKLRFGMNAAGPAGATGQNGATGPASSGFPLREATGGPYVNYVSQAPVPVPPLTVNEDAVYIARVSLDVTNTDATNPHDAYCAAVRLSDSRVIAGGYSPGTVNAGQTVPSVEFAGVAQLKAGAEIAAGCQTTGPFDLDNVDLDLIEIVPGH